MNIVSHAVAGILGALFLMTYLEMREPAPCSPAPITMATISMLLGPEL